jgi:hypothetical protein
MCTPFNHKLPCPCHSPEYLQHDVRHHQYKAEPCQQPTESPNPFNTIIHLFSEVINQPGLLDGSATRGPLCSDILNCEMEPTRLVFGPPSDPGVVSSRQDELIPGLSLPSPLVQDRDGAFISSLTESSWAASSSTAPQNTIAVSSPVAARQPHATNDLSGLTLEPPSIEPGPLQR